MKRRVFFVLLLAAMLTGFNMFKTLNLDNSSTINNLLSVNALANEEDGMGSDMQKVIAYDCVFVKKVIIGFDADNNPIFDRISSPGYLGICNGDRGPCSSYPCTESL